MSKPKPKDQLKKKMGARPKLSRDKVTPKALGVLASLGARNSDIADIYGISLGCFKAFLKNNPDILTTLKEDKAKADSAVEASLYMQALGFHYPETRTAYNAVLDKWASIEVQVYSKPNVAAQIFWLKCRLPEKWRELQEFSGRFEHKHEGEMTVNHVIKPEDVTDEHRNRVRENIGILQRYGALGSGVGQN